MLGAVVLIVAIGAIIMSKKEPADADAEPPRTGSVSESAVQEFTEKVREETVREVGQPIEGFEPFMFMRAFPALTEADFDGVDALIGGYVYENGELRYDLQGEQELHSAARAISDEGMATLLSNVASRLNFNLEGEATIDEVLAAMNEGETDSGNISSDETVRITGEVVCLPHKDRSGPQTLECALGLEAANGMFYGLKQVSAAAPLALDTGARVTVTGVITPPEASTKYDIARVIEVQSIAAE